MEYLIPAKLFAYNKKRLDGYVMWKTDGDNVRVRHCMPNKTVRIWLEINTIRPAFNPYQ